MALRQPSQALIQLGSQSFRALPELTEYLKSLDAKDRYKAQRHVLQQLVTYRTTLGDMIEDSTSVLMQTEHGLSNIQKWSSCKRW
jgi:hypothetical protein